MHSLHRRRISSPPPPSSSSASSRGLSFRRTCTRPAVLQKILIISTVIWLVVTLLLNSRFADHPFVVILLHRSGRSFDDIYSFLQPARNNRMSSSSQRLSPPLTSAWDKPAETIQNSPFPSVLSPSSADDDGDSGSTTTGHTRLIPKVIHRIWKTREDDSLPPVFAAILDEWRRAEPEYEQRIASDMECRLLARRFSRRFLQLYDALLLNVMRADICRILLMYYEGGIYIDLDVRPRVALAQFVNRRVNAVLGWQNEAAGEVAPWFMAARPRDKCFYRALQFFERTIRPATRGFGDFRHDPHLVGVFTGNYAMGQAFKGCVRPILTEAEVSFIKIVSLDGSSFHGRGGGGDGFFYSHYIKERDRLAQSGNGNNNDGADDAASSSSDSSFLFPGTTVWTVILGNDPIDQFDMLLQRETEMRKQDNNETIDDHDDDNDDNDARMPSPPVLLASFDENVRERWRDQLLRDKHMLRRGSVEYRVIREEECFRLALLVPQLIRVVGELQRHKLLRAVCGWLAVYHFGGAYADPHLAPAAERGNDEFFLNNFWQHDGSSNNKNVIQVATQSASATMRPSWYLRAAPRRSIIVDAISQLAGMLDPACKTVIDAAQRHNNNNKPLVWREGNDQGLVSTVLDEIFATLISKESSSSKYRVEKLAVSDMFLIVPTALQSGGADSKAKKSKQQPSSITPTTTTVTHAAAAAATGSTSSSPTMIYYSIELAGSNVDSSDRDGEPLPASARLYSAADDDDVMPSPLLHVQILRDAECSDLAARPLDGDSEEDSHAMLRSFEGAPLTAMRSDVCRWLVLYHCGGAVVDRSSLARTKSGRSDVAVVSASVSAAIKQSLADEKKDASSHLIYALVSNNSSSSKSDQEVASLMLNEKLVVMSPTAGRDRCVAALLRELRAALHTLPRSSSVDYRSLDASHQSLRLLYEQSASPRAIAAILRRLSSASNSASAAEARCPRPSSALSFLLLQEEENAADKSKESIVEHEILRRSGRVSSRTKKERNNNNNIPRELHVLWKNETLFQPALDIDSEWRIREPLYRRNLVTDADCTALAKRFPGLYPRYAALPMNVMRADICRVLAVYFLGGVYMDLDVAWSRPMSEWFDATAMDQSGVSLGEMRHRDDVQQQQRQQQQQIIIGWEEKSIGQYCNWFFAATPFHPCMEQALRGITQRVMCVTEDTVHNMNERPWLVHETTGPISFTASIRRCVLRPQLSAQQVLLDNIEHRFASQKWEKNAAYGSWTSERQRRLGCNDTWCKREQRAAAAARPQRSFVPWAGYFVDILVSSTTAVHEQVSLLEKFLPPAVCSPFEPLSLAAAATVASSSGSSSTFDHRVAHSVDSVRSKWQHVEKDASDAESDTAKQARQRVRHGGPQAGVVKYRLLHRDECDVLILYRHQQRGRKREFDPALEKHWLRLSAYLDAGISLLRDGKSLATRSEESLSSSSSSSSSWWWYAVHDTQLMICRLAVAYYYGGISVDASTAAAARDSSSSIHNNWWETVATNSKTSDSTVSRSSSSSNNFMMPKVPLQRWFDDAADFVAIKVNNEHSTSRTNSNNNNKAVPTRGFFASAPRSPVVKQMLERIARVVVEEQQQHQQQQQRSFMTAESLEEAVRGDAVTAALRDAVDQAFGNPQPLEAVRWYSRSDLDAFV